MGRVAEGACAMTLLAHLVEAALYLAVGRDFSTDCEYLIDTAAARNARATGETR